MSDQDNPLIARLAVQRLAMPGVIDRAPMQRKCEQLQQPLAKHALTAQLQRRVHADGAAAESSLVWRAAERAEAVVEAVPRVSRSAAPNTTSAASVPDTAPVVQRSVMPGAEPASRAERLTARAHTPGMLATGAAPWAAREGGSRFEAGSSGAAHFAATVQARYGLAPATGASATVSAAPALSISRAPTSVIRRHADTTAAPLMTSETGTASAVALPTTSRSRESALHFNPLGPSLRWDDGRSHAAAVNKLVTPMSIGAQGVSRQRLINSPGTPSLVPSATASSGSDAPLILRRMMAPPAPSSIPGSIPPTTVGLPQVETPAAPAPEVASMPELQAAQPGADLERIVEEVGRRLLRRLEIERERKGIRQWR